jgi:hypothetical protein
MPRSASSKLAKMGFADFETVTAQALSGRHVSASQWAASVRATRDVQPEYPTAFSGRKKPARPFSNARLKLRVTEEHEVVDFWVTEL